MFFEVTIDKITQKKCGPVFVGYNINNFQHQSYYYSGTSVCDQAEVQSTRFLNGCDLKLQYIQSIN